MPEVAIHAHSLTAIVVRPYLDSEHGPFAVVSLDEAMVDTRIHVTPDGVRRAREVASALNAAADAVEDAVLSAVWLGERSTDSWTPEDEPRPAA